MKEIIQKANSKMNMRLLQLCFIPSIYNLDMFEHVIYKICNLLNKLHSKCVFVCILNSTHLHISTCSKVDARIFYFCLDVNYQVLKIQNRMYMYFFI